MRLIIIMTIAILSLPAMAKQYTYSGMNTRGQMIDVNVNPRGISETYNYNTGVYSEIDNVRNNGLGGVTGEVRDYNTGGYSEVQIDSYGNVDIYDW